MTTLPIGPFNTLDLMPIQPPQAGLFDGFTMFPLREGDRTAEINNVITAAIADRKPNLFMRPGVYPIRSPLVPGFAITIEDAPGLATDWNGSQIIQVWDGVNQATLGDCFGVFGGYDVAFINGSYDIFPAVMTQGVCTAIGVTFKMAIAPDKEPTWAVDRLGDVMRGGADNVLWVDPTQDGNDGKVDVIDWQYAAAGKKSASYDFLPTDQYAPNGWRIYEGKPLGRRANPTAILDYSPLRFRFPADTIIGSDVGIGSGFPVGLAAILAALPNGGRVRLSLDDADNDTIVTVFDTNGETVDASSVSGEPFTSGGFDVEGVPYWMQVGQMLVVQFRKRLSRPVVARGVGGKVTFKDWNFRSACAAGLLYDCNDIVFENCVYKSATGHYLSSTAGPFQIYNPRGGIFFLGNGFEAWGAGDDPINARTRSWNAVGAVGIQTYDVAASWLRVKFTAALTDLTQIPVPPLVGDLIRFVPPGTVGQTVLPILAVTDEGGGITRVDFGAGNIPGGFDPATWAVWSRTTAPTVQGTRYHVYGSAARGAIFSSSFTNIADFFVSGSNGTPSRSLINGMKEGGHEGNQHYGRYEVRRVVTNHNRYGNAAVLIGSNKLDGSLIDAPTGYPKNTIGSLIIDGCGFGGIYVVGEDLDVLSHSFTNMGTKRGTIPPTFPGAYDILSSHGTVRMLGGSDGSDNFSEDSGGEVQFPQLGIGGSVSANVDGGTL